ncbi:uncharacterized protein CXQ87_000830 [Candidozyma duobushaemuli]|uniref:Transcription factor IIIC 90kDa subunit N-terminal domain-containing protein n=1 Tax=Candidozyma duobushaemuli TaxID=1231522 RepID=A0A2V1AJ54_9ASCO|nr:uncharacterized protein CXQ87_000830 [[Candida] duobushaemulonis]PVH17928.1 hypothetical protein CXQ87_000830 [[Candida] duobushaemulonis]
MSLAKSIVVGRAIAESGLLDPVQCSDNSQVAINNSDHLTVLEPKLPLLHNWISNGASAGSKKSTIDPNDLYDVRGVFNIADLESLGLQIFSKLLIEDGEDRFSFGRIAEPLIISHAWSPVDDSTRDCFLGVLFNTGEVLVLKRTTQDSGQYDVVIRSFTSLLDNMNIPQNRLTSEGDIIVTNAEHLELKITSFTFGKASNGALYILLAHESGSVSIHSLSRGLPEVSRLQAGGTIVKSAWSQDLSTTALLMSDNSVHTISLDDSMQPKSDTQNVKSASRFLVSHLKFISTDTLIVTDSKALHVIKGGSIRETKLPYRSTISGVSFAKSSAGFTAFLSFECGHFSMLTITEEGECTLRPSPQTWTNFVNRTLLQFQYACLKEQNKAPSNVFKPFLNDKVDGNLMIHGSHHSSNGDLVFAYNVVPKNVIHHEIRSKAEFKVAVVSALELDPQITIDQTLGTSISQIHGILLRDYQSFPTPPSNGKEGITEFIRAIQEWKMHNFVDFGEVNLNVSPHESLNKTLSEEFLHNNSIRDLQKLFTFNSAYIATLEALESNEELGTVTAPAKEKVIDEQEMIKTKLATQLRQAVLSLVKFRDLITEADKFLYLSFVKTLPIDYQSQFSNLPAEVKWTESTDLVTETFRVAINQKYDKSFERFALSDSSHSWRRCDLTLFPILSLNNKADESNTFVYSIAEHEPDDPTQLSRLHWK